MLEGMKKRKNKYDSGLDIISVEQIKATRTFLTGTSIKAWVITMVATLTYAEGGKSDLATWCKNGLRAIDPREQNI